MDKTIRGSSEWKYLYRAVDRAGHTIDFLRRRTEILPQHAVSWNEPSILHGVPDKITIDRSGANTAAIQSVQSDCGADIELRHSKYLDNVVEQDHRAVKGIVRPVLGFKSFGWARVLIAGILTMHMIKKGQLNRPEAQALSAASRFYSLAF